MLHILLVTSAIAAVVAWVVLSAYVLLVQRRRDAARATISAAAAALALDEVKALPLGERLDRIRPLLAPVSRDPMEKPTPRGTRPEP